MVIGRLAVRSAERQMADRDFAGGIVRIRHDKPKCAGVVASQLRVAKGMRLVVGTGVNSGSVRSTSGVV
jgi:hypothetical protein